MGFNAGNRDVQSFTISEDLSAKQFYVVKSGTSANSVLLADTAGGVVVGVLQDTGLDGSSSTEHAEVAIMGESLCKIGGTVSKDDPLQADTDGMAIVATTGDYVFARADEAGVDGDYIKVRITHEGTF